MNIDKQALTTESARESGNILLIVAARMARRELFTPLHYVSGLPQKVVGMRIFREALEQCEETLQREVCKIVDGHNRMAKKLKEAEAKLEAAEKHIAELESKNGYLRTIAHEQNELAIRASLDSNNATVEMGRLHKRIAELEAREVTLPPTFWYEHDDLSRDVPVLDKRLVKKAIRAAGIKAKES